MWTLAWPSIITNLFYATSSIVAIKIVGNLGPDAIAAAVTGQRVTFILQAVLTGVLAGSTALIARNWGANDRLEAGVFFTRTVQLVLFLSLISSMLVWQFAEPLVRFFGLKDQALVLSAQYLQAISPFYVAFGCGMGLITALRAVGDVKTPLFIGLIMNIFAIFFMLVFVNGWLGFPNYGVVVILFAVLIKAVTYPLMAKQLRSTKKMQEIQPELNKIKLKYKSDPALQQQKMSALFQKSGVNPLAGCLPMLVQFPVLIAVFMVFRNTIEFRGEPFFLWITDLASPDTLFMLGSIPINVLPFLMSLSMFYTMKVSTAAQSPGGDPAQEATQKMMKYMFPGMMFFLFYGFPSGLNLYYLCFNVIQIIQQKIINKEK